MRIKANKITQHFKIKLKNSIFVHWKMKIRMTKFSFHLTLPKKAINFSSFPGMELA